MVYKLADSCFWKLIRAHFYPLTYICVLIRKCRKKLTKQLITQSHHAILYETDEFMQIDLNVHTKNVESTFRFADDQWS